MPRSTRVTYAVFDIDGVLADVRHRLHFIATRPKNWRAFFEAATADPPLQVGIDRALAAVVAGLTIVYLTGRPENYRQATQAWLDRFGLPPGALHMRGSNDHRPARATKVAVLRELSKAGDIGEFVDDDPDVVAAVRAAEFPADHATWMVVTTDQQGELFAAQEIEGRS